MSSHHWYWVLISSCFHLKRESSLFWHKWSWHIYSSTVTKWTAVSIYTLTKDAWSHTLFAFTSLSTHGKSFTCSRLLLVYWWLTITFLLISRLSLISRHSRVNLVTIYEIYNQSVLTSFDSSSFTLKPLISGKR